MRSWRSASASARRSPRPTGSPLEASARIQPRGRRGQGRRVASTVATAWPQTRQRSSLPPTGSRSGSRVAPACRVPQDDLGLASRPMDAAKATPVPFSQRIDREADVLSHELRVTWSSGRPSSRPSSGYAVPGGRQPVPERARREVPAESRTTGRPTPLQAPTYSSSTDLVPRRDVGVEPERPDLGQQGRLRVRVAVDQEHLAREARIAGPLARARSSPARRAARTRRRGPRSR